MNIGLTWTSNQRTIIFALILIFFQRAAATLILVYSDGLFLATYKQEWLSYLVIASTLTTVISVLVINPLLAKSSNRRTAVLIVVTTAIMLLLMFLNYTHIFWIPFILCVYLNFFYLLLSVITSNALAGAFGIRRYRQIASLILAVGSVASILAGYSSTWISTLFGSHNLLTVIIVFSFLNALCVYYLTPVEFVSVQARAPRKVWNYPLLKALFLVSMCIGFTSVIANYVLKYQLPAVYNQKQIISYLGNLQGTVNFVILIIQLCGMEKAFERFGLRKLIMITPATILFALIYFIYAPGIPSATGLLLVLLILRGSYTQYIGEMSYNALPYMIRKAGKLWERGIIGPIGDILSISLIVILLHYFPLYSLGYLGLVSCGLWLWLAHVVDQAYRKALLEDIKTKRYMPGFLEINEIDKKLLHQLTVTGLNGSEPDSIRFGLLSLRYLNVDLYSNSLVDKLSSPYVDIKLLAIGVIKNNPNQQYFYPLLQALEKEHDPIVVWEIIKTLVELDPLRTFPYALAWLLKLFSTHKEFQFIVNEVNTNEFSINSLYQVLNSGVHHTNPKVRWSCAKLIDVMKIANSEQYLQVLLQDSQPKVLLEAINCVANKHAESCLPLLINNLQNPRVAYKVAKTLVMFADSAIPYLDNIIGKNKLCVQKMAIFSLVLINNHAAELTLLKYSRHDSVLVRTIIVQQLSYRLESQKWSKEFYAEGVTLLQETKQEIIFLRFLLKQDMNKLLVAELNVCLFLAIERFLCWYAIVTRSLTVIGLIPVLTHIGKSALHKQRYINAIEVLDNVANIGVLRKSLDIFDDAATQQLDSLSPSVIKLQQWISRLKQIYQQQGADVDELISKVMVLRNVKLFENIPFDALYEIAAETNWRPIMEEEMIFSQGDIPDGFYMIASGEVIIQAKNVTLNILKEGDFFGEVSLFDQSPRTADAIAKTSGMLLHIDNVTFDGITRDLPEVVHAIARSVITYLRNLVKVDANLIN